MGILSGICAIAGSKLLFALTQIGELLDSFSIRGLCLLVWRSGLVFYGGLFGTIFALCLYTRKDRDKRKRVFQTAAPAIPLFHGFGRIGCFLAGCCYGRELPKPVQCLGMELDRVPVQLIESAAEFVLFFVLLFVEKRREDYDLLRIYLISYAVFRFFDEFLRGDALRGVFLGVSTSQWISVFILGYYLVKWRRARGGAIRYDGWDSKQKKADA